MAWLTDWEKRIKLTSDNTKVAASVKGLALDLSTLPADFWTNVKSDGADIRVTSSDGETLVARDIVSIDTIAETGLIRFDTSSISTSANTDYYLYYGNASATEPLATDTYGQYNAYDTNWRAYIRNSGSAVENRVNTSISMSVSNNRIWDNSVNGDYGKVLDFSQGNDYITISTNLFSNQTYSHYFKVKHNNLGVTEWYFGDGATSGCSPSSSGIGKTDTNNIRFWTGCESPAPVSSQTITNNVWNIIAGTKNNRDKKTFVNGALGNSFTSSITSFSNGNNILGCAWGGGVRSSFVNGYFEEVIFFNTTVSDNDIITLSNADYSNDTFWTVSAPEEPGFTITTLPASHVTFSSAQFNGEVANYD